MKNNLKRILMFILALVLVTSNVLVYFPQEVSAESEIVNIPDANLKAALNRNLGVADETADITKTQLETITWLQMGIYNSQYVYVADLTGLEYCTNLKNLRMNVSSADIDFTKIEALPLTSLDIYLSSSVEGEIDLSPIGNIDTLTHLYLDTVDAKDYSFLGSLPNLKYLDIFYGNILAIPDMSASTNLEVFDVTRTDIADISGLANCNNLKTVDLEGSYELEDITPLKGKTSMTYLDLEKVNITEENEVGYMETVSSLVNLETLHFGYVDLQDKHMSMLDPLTKLVELQMVSSEITDASFLLSHKDVLKRVTIAGSDVDNDAAAVLKQMTKLTTLGISSTGIEDFSFISSLPNLTAESLRWSEWNTTFKTGTSSSDSYKVPSDAETYVIDNEVKNHNGELVAPVASENYTYDAATGKITLNMPLDSTYKSIYVKYDFTMSTNKGKTLYATHSRNVTLRREVALVINTQPVSKNLTEGDKLSLSVSAKGDGTLSYQWYKDGNAINGATSSTYTVTASTLTDSGTYYVAVTDKNGSVTSNEATVTVNKKTVPLTIKTQPKNVTVTEGDKVTLSVVAEGEGTLSYQWYKGESAISGATSSTYTVAASTLADAGTYYVVVTDSNGSVTSNEATVTVNKKIVPLAIKTQPENVTVQEGGKVTLSVVAEGEGTLSYQWYKEDTAISGAIAATYTIDETKLTDAGSYTVKITDSLTSVTSNPANVTVTAKPVELKIIVQPIDVTVKEGGELSLSVTAQGDGTLNYQWYKDGSEISGATSSTYTVANVTEADAGKYYVVVGDNSGSVISNECVVTVEKNTVEPPTEQPTEEPTEEPVEEPAEEPVNVDAPNTGDTTPIMLLVVVMIISLGMVLLIGKCQTINK